MNERENNNKEKIKNLKKKTLCMSYIRLSGYINRYIQLEKKKSIFF